MQIPISLVIITYNEATNIKAAIESAQAFVEEILVLDSFSTDETCTIAKNLGAKVIQRTFTNYVDQKNHAASLAQFDCILSLDADEVLSPALQVSISNAKLNWMHPIWQLNRLTNYCGHWIHHCDWYPDTKIRLYDRRKAAWQGVLIHEKVQSFQPESLGFLEGDILHYSYKSISEHVVQLNKFTDIGAKEDFQKGKRSTLLKICFSPIFKMIKSYILKKGFLDGYYGFVVCAISAFASFLKYVKLYQLQQDRG